jgi:hypothetical protein
VYASDRDRDRAAATLKAGYVDGRLTFGELSDRADLVLGARSRAELRRALAGLQWRHDDVAELGRSAVRTAARGALLVVCTAAWFVFSFALFVVFGLTMLFQGASGSALLGFLLVWLVPTYLLARLWRSPSRRQ